MKRPIQYFTPEYLQQCRRMTPTAIAHFLEEFRRMLPATTTPLPQRKLISMKVPIPLLRAFQDKARSQGVRYQTQIQRLMQAWLQQNP